MAQVGGCTSLAGGGRAISGLMQAYRAGVELDPADEPDRRGYPSQRPWWMERHQFYLWLSVRICVFAILGNADIVIAIMESESGNTDARR